MHESKYCALGLYLVGADKPTLMASNKRIVLFDTLAIAQEVLPILGGEGRFASWDAGKETCFWTPIEPSGFNRAAILTAYDPSDLPANMPNGILSEARGREWKYHVMWSHVMTDCGQFVRTTDGMFTNTATSPAHRSLHFRCLYGIIC